jgi:hypothetical protein
MAVKYKPKRNESYMVQTENKLKMLSLNTTLLIITIGKHSKIFNSNA